MDNFNTQKSYRGILKSKIFLIFILALLVVVSRATFKAYERDRYSRTNLEILERQKEELLSREDQLSSKINDLETGSGQEKIIREKFGVAKDGEGVVVLYEPEEGASSEVKGESGFWQNIKRWFNMF